jgi:hypothetical protein
MGQQREPDADVLFASIQTLGRVAHLERLPRDGFAIASWPRSARHGPDRMGLTAQPGQLPVLSLAGENEVRFSPRGAWVP